MIPDAFIIDLEIRIELNKKKNKNSFNFTAHELVRLNGEEN